MKKTSKVQNIHQTIRLEACLLSKIGDSYGIILPGRIPPVTSLVFIDLFPHFCLHGRLYLFKKANKCAESVYHNIWIFQHPNCGRFYQTIDH